MWIFHFSPFTFHLKITTFAPRITITFFHPSEIQLSATHHKQPSHTSRFRLNRRHFVDSPAHSAHSVFVFRRQLRIVATDALIPARRLYLPYPQCWMCRPCRLYDGRTEQCQRVAASQLTYARQYARCAAGDCGHRTQVPTHPHHHVGHLAVLLSPLCYLSAAQSRPHLLDLSAALYSIVVLPKTHLVHTHLLAHSELLPSPLTTLLHGFPARRSPALLGVWRHCCAN